LRDLDLSGLRARWHSVFRRQAPDHLPRHLLYRILTYRLQADRFGDLDRDTQRFLDEVAAGTRNANEIPAASNQASRHGLQPGTVLVREWTASLSASWCSRMASSGTARPIAA
jgi:hypothetical protein